MSELNKLGVRAIVEGIKKGEFRSEDVLQDCLARIKARDGSIRAWAAIDDWQGCISALRTS
jgi:Asp-tRNA(Asn)/Glu-tRNA(Gln) amidotransferase A subunit family amidase